MSDQQAELPLDIRPNPATYFEPPVKAKRGKRSAAQAQGAPSESVTASADAIEAELERCAKEARVIRNVLKTAEIAPSKVNIEAAQADLAALEQRRSELQAQLKASAQKNVTASAPAKRRHDDDDDDDADDDDADDEFEDDDAADVPIDWHSIARKRRLERDALHSEARRLAESGDLDGVRSVHDRAQGVLSVMRSIPDTSLTVRFKIESAAEACAEIASMASAAHESVTPIALAEPSLAQANGAHESVTSAALAEPSLAQANGAHESVTSAALAEPSLAQANGAQVIVDIVRRWNGSDVAATLRTVAADRLRGDVTVMALDAPIATYRNGALAPELVTLARRCTVPRHTWRVDTPDAARQTVVYLLEYASDQRVVISSPISTAAKRLRECSARVIEAMPYERYDRYLSAAQRAKTRVNGASAQASAAQESVTASALAEPSAPIKPSGKRAEPAHYTLTCVVCGHQFEAKRSHAQTCSAKCRKRLSRANGAE